MGPAYNKALLLATVFDTAPALWRRGNNPRPPNAVKEIMGNCTFSAEEAMLGGEETSISVLLMFRHAMSELTDTTEPLNDQN
ncbi:hypothetical protein BaRGS_00003919 [Batillaria attramentaria]|uniref:Uncharacterized protein n=1 Tax=Batillaria attramentaria TaxID=370345 RepID=A0ABD0M051_9CAEN